MKALIWSEIKQRIYFSETFGSQQVTEKRRVNSLAEFPTSGYEFLHYTKMQQNSEAIL